MRNLSFVPPFQLQKTIKFQLELGYHIIILLGLPLDILLDLNQRLYLSKAELNTKNSTRWQLCCHLVEFLDFNSIVDIEKK